MVLPAGAKLRIYSGFRSDLGKVRDRNEDALYQSKVPLGYLAAVSDGIGGHESGDVAAAITIAAVVGEVQSETTDPVAAIQRGFEVANRILRSRSNETGYVMGSTCVVALICNSLLYVGHVGDARLYLLRGANLYSLTRDHSLMQEIADIKGPQAATGFAPSLKHIMSRSVGAEENINPSIRDPIPLLPGDTVLLCTDGLTNTVNDRRIRRTLAGATPREAATRLVDMANEEGGPDNISVVVLHVDADSPAEETKRLTLDELMSMRVRTADGDLHPIVDVVINPTSWAVAALRLDLRAAGGGVCQIPITEIGPISGPGEPIVTPQRSEALLDMAEKEL